MADSEEKVCCSRSGAQPSGGGECHCEGGGHGGGKTSGHSCCGAAGGGESHGGSCCCGSGAKRSGGGGSCCGSARSGIPDGARLWISFAALAAGFAVGSLHVPWPLFPLTDPSWIAVALCGWPIAKGAWESLRGEGRVTSALLITIAIFSAIALQLLESFGGAQSGHGHASYIFAAGEIAFLMGLGEMIEARTVRKTREGVEALVKIAPKTAMLKTADGFSETPVGSLKVGDIVLVRPNCMISVDGEIVEGGGAVDQSSMTGESVPVDKKPGDTVLAGTWNKSGPMMVRVSKLSSQTAISKLISLVEEAEGKKAPISRVANKWAGRIVPAAVATSVAVFLFTRLALETDMATSLVRAVTILVVFCPCAFALATPTAVAAGIGNASRRGILVKSGAAIEELSYINCVAFDKTGTLTTASLKVEAVAGFGISEDEALALCAGAESYSEHPIARAVAAAARGRVEIPEPESTKALTGIGVECSIGGRRILVCSYRAAVDSGAAVDAAAREYAESRLERGETLVCLVADSKLAGIISLSDEIRPGAASAVAELGRLGYSTAILTGDNPSAAARVASETGVARCFSSLMPDGKVAAIEGLRRGGAKVLMIGDGVNDAPALAAADCSAAMGALGSDLAVETADIAFLNDNISLVPGLLKFSKAVMFKIRSNIVLSLAISFSAVILSAAGVLDPVSGALLHNVSSVTVVLNSASLLARKKDYDGAAKAS